LESRNLDVREKRKEKRGEKGALIAGCLLLAVDFFQKVRGYHGKDLHERNSRIRESRR